MTSWLTFLSCFRNGAGDEFLYIWKFFCPHKIRKISNMISTCGLIGIDKTHPENWPLIL